MSIIQVHNNSVKELCHKEIKRCDLSRLKAVEVYQCGRHINVIMLNSQAILYQVCLNVDRFQFHNQIYTYYLSRDTPYQPLILSADVKLFNFLGVHRIPASATEKPRKNARPELHKFAIVCVDQQQSPNVANVISFELDKS